MIFLTLLETFAPLSTVRPRERLIGGYSTIQNKVRSGIIVKHALKTKERKRKEKEETTVLPYKTFYPSPKHFTITRERIIGFTAENVSRELENYNFHPYRRNHTFPETSFHPANLSIFSIETLIKVCTQRNTRSSQLFYFFLFLLFFLSISIKSKNR